MQCDFFHMNTIKLSGTSQSSWAWSNAHWSQRESAGWTLVGAGFYFIRAMVGDLE